MFMYNAHMCMPRVIAADFLRVLMTDLQGNISMSRVCERFIDGCIISIIKYMSHTYRGILICDPSC